MKARVIKNGKYFNVYKGKKLIEAYTTEGQAIYRVFIINYY